MIKEEWQHNPELYFKATLLRLHRREVNITTDELAEAEKYVLVAHYTGDKVLCQIGIVEAWPESEQRIDAIGQNGNTGEHYAEINKIIGDAFCYGRGFARNGKHIPHDEVMRDPDDDIEVNGS